MLAQDVGFHRRWIDTQPPSQVKSEAQAIEKRSTAQDVLESERTDKIGQRIRWIGENEDYRIRRRTKQRRKDFTVDAGVHIEQPEPAGRIVPVRRPTSLFIRASADHQQRRT